MSDTTRKWAALGIAVVAITLATILFLRNASDHRKYPQELTVDGVCLNCKQEVKARVQATSDFAPYDCPSCKDTSVYPWFYCDNCRKRFVPELIPGAGKNGKPALPIAPKCTACKSNLVLQYIPGFSSPPVGDTPLPKWPQ